MFEYSR